MPQANVASLCWHQWHISLGPLHHFSHISVGVFGELQNHEPPWTPHSHFFRLCYVMLEFPRASYHFIARTSLPAAMFSLGCQVTAAFFFFVQAITISTNHSIVMPQLLSFLQLCAVECQVNSCQFSRAPYEDEGIGLKYGRLVFIQTARGHRFLLELFELGWNWNKITSYNTIRQVVHVCPLSSLL